MDLVVVRAVDSQAAVRVHGAEETADGDAYRDTSGGCASR